MPPVLFYLLKFSISLGVIWAFYRVFLRRLTFYSWNRWYLLIYSLLCLGIPFINITPWIGEETSRAEPVFVRAIPALPLPGAYGSSGGTVPEASGWGMGAWDIAGAVLLAGALFFLVRLLIRLASLRKVRRGAKRLYTGRPEPYDLHAGGPGEGGVGTGGLYVKEPDKDSQDGFPIIYQVDAPIVPFSFGRSIYINQHLHSEKEWEQIILHEYVHVKQKHTIDILLAECLCIVNWYNPCAWMIRFAIRQNLEFIADHQVLEKGSDRVAYQYHLLKVIGAPAYRIASNFNFSSLKKRIVMMNAIRSARVNLLRFLFILPLLAVLVLAFRDRFPVGSVPGARKAGAGSSLPTPKEENGFPAAVQANGKMVPGAPGGQAGGQGGSLYNGMMLDTIPASGKTRRKDEPLIIIDGKRAEKEDVDNLNSHPGQVGSVKVLTGDDALRAYGKEGRHGVMVITTKTDTMRSVIGYPTDKLQDGVVQGYATPVDVPVLTVVGKPGRLANGDSVRAVVVRRGHPEKTDSVWIVIGRPTHRPDSIGVKEIPASAVPGEEAPPAGSPLKISPDVRLYPLTVPSKGLQLRSALTLGPPTSDILVYVDGKETSYADFQRIDPGVMQTITVFKGSAATDRFGERAWNGAIVAETKAPVIRLQKKLSITDSQGTVTGQADSIVVHGPLLP